MSASSVAVALVSAGLLAAPVALPTASPASPTTAAIVPCPHVTPPTIPPTPASPPRDAAAPVVGGAGLATTGLAAPAAVKAPPATSAQSWVVADLDTGAILGACDPHLRRRPASVQKLLLADTALPKLNPSQVVVATAADLKLPRVTSAVGMVVGGHYPVSTLWYGLLLESGNDAANALARVAGGSGGVPATIAAMNAEAHRLGADDTHAVTPSGLDAADQFTSAYDLALIARADFARPDFVRYDTALRFQWPAQPPRDPHGFQIQNENKLLTEYPGALGGKTGFTDQARHTYVGAAQRGGRRLVVTVMGAEIVPARAEKQGEALLNWGFGLPATASVGHLVTADEAARLHNPPSASGSHRPARVRVAPAGAGAFLDTRTPQVILGVVLLVLAVAGMSLMWRLRRGR
ncbi:D-alanyl-D-alanine carboxypeptidase family protein [Rugosimonospora africana]|uniref:D-alanyl-D-alanine carboxypeptidase family protein n=1 Tax=Rugosimonospora africana TaxID=556532 RepID=UPI001EF1F215|nr:serine hydrolase [Rugosimonospora africana]